MNKVPVIIDTDMGVDDAYAMLVALNSDMLDIKLITTVSGNVSIDKVNKNILFMSERYLPKVDVAGGANKPLVQEPIYAEDVHGESGFGNFKYQQAKKQLIKENAVEAIKNVLENSNQPTTLITLGPLTNIALFVEKYPQLLSKIDKVYAMIGSYTGKGNITPHAEFNAYVDPEAVDIVLRTNLNIIFSPVEIGWDTVIKKEILFSHSTTREEKMLKEMAEGTCDVLGKENFSIHDLNTVMAVLKPELFEFKNCDATISLENEIKGKMTFPLNEKGRFKVQIVKNNKKLIEEDLKILYGE